MPTLHPSYIIRKPEEKIKLVTDLKKVFLYIKTGKEGKRPTQYYIVNTKSQFDWLIDNLNKNDLWSNDTETTGDKSGSDFLKHDIFIATFSWKETTSVLIDFRSPFVVNNEEYVWEKFKEVFANGSKKIFQNGSFDVKFWEKRGIIVNNFYADTMLMHHLLDENKRHGLDVLAYEYTDCGGYDIGLEQYKMQNKIINYANIPEHIIHPYALMDADVTLRSYNAMLPKIMEQKLDCVLFNITMPAQRRLIKTELDGICINLEHLDKTNEKYDKDIKNLMDKILKVPEVEEYTNRKENKERQDFVDRYNKSKALQKKYKDVNTYINVYGKDKIKFEFNINSHLQLKELLLDQMHLPIIKNTKKGRIITDKPSLDKEVLAKYAKKNTFCSYLSEYRSLDTLKSTFLVGTKNKLNSDGKLRTRYQLTGTVTGRPSSVKPNLNNVPRANTAKDIKDVFIADEGCWLVEGDGAQIEFRVWINNSRDPQALKDIGNGYDIHKMTAATISGKELSKTDLSAEDYKELIKDVTKDMRQKAKATVFGLPYGQGVDGTAAKNGLTVEQAQKIIDSYFGRYPAARTYLQKTVAIARRDGYAKSLFGRRRRLPDIKSSDSQKYALSERQAKNAGIQATASDLTLMALERICSVIDKKGLKSRLVLTVYDSLIFNVLDEELKFMAHLIYDELTKKTSDQIIIPLDAEIKIGKSWGSLIEVDLDEDWNVAYDKLIESLTF